MAVKKGTLVQITWLDSVGVTSAWEFRDELDSLKCAKIKTVGFVEKWGKKRLTVAQSISKEQVLGRITIPRGCVVEVRKRS